MATIVMLYNLTFEIEKQMASNVFKQFILFYISTIRHVQVRQLLEVAVLAPHGLGHHLGQLHGRDGGTQPAVAAQHVHTCLDTAALSWILLRWA